MKNKLEAYIRNDLNGAGILIRMTAPGGKVFVGEPIFFKEYEPGSYISEATLQLPWRDDTFLQSIVDQAWDIGIRPRFAKDGKPEAEALKYHLEDMRRLVFKDKSK